MEMTGYRRRRFMDRRRGSMEKKANALSLRVIEGAQNEKDRSGCRRLLNGPIFLMILSLTAVEFLSWLAFTPLYMYISVACNLESRTFMRSFYFSMITQTTIGYSAPDLSFAGCPWALLVIGCQTVVGLILNGILIGTLYTRIARSRRNVIEIIFSEKAIIAAKGDSFFLSFRVMDQKTSNSVQLLEAEIRCYAIKHQDNTKGNTSDRPLYFQQSALKLSHSSHDECTARLLLAIPTVVTHRIDIESALYPPQEQYESTRWTQRRRTAALGDNQGSLVADTLNHAPSSVKQYMTHFCHSPENSVDQQRHDEHNVLLEAGLFNTSPPDQRSVPASRLQANTTQHRLADDFSPLYSHQYSIDAQKFRDHFQHSDLEVLVIVQAIDTFSAATITARHSYNFHDCDFLFDQAFRPCVTLGTDGAAVINLDAFNETMNNIQPQQQLPVINSSNPFEDRILSNNNHSAPTTMTPVPYSSSSAVLSPMMPPPASPREATVGTREASPP